MTSLDIEKNTLVAEPEAQESASEVCFGRSGSDQKPFIWKPGSIANDAMVVAGGSGEGKSNFVKNFVLQRLQCPDEPCVHILDMHNDYKPIVQCAVEKLGFEQHLLCEPTQHGLPFRLLGNLGNFKSRFASDNVLSDFKSAGARLGSNQTAALRRALERGIDEKWTNPQLFRHLENLDEAANLQNQIAQTLALLDFPGIELPELLSHRLVRHDLSRLQDPTSRAAYAISLISQITQLRQLEKGSNEKSKHSPLIFIFEEAFLLNGASSQMRRFFNEARKLQCSGAFVSQLWSEIPKFVKDNCATRVLFGSAQQSEKSGRLKKFEALIQTEDTGMALQISQNVFTEDYRQRFDIDTDQVDSFQEITALDKAHAKTPTKKDRIQEVKAEEEPKQESRVTTEELFLRPHRSFRVAQNHQSIRDASSPFSDLSGELTWYTVIAAFKNEQMREAVLFDPYTEVVIRSFIPFQTEQVETEDTSRAGHSDLAKRLALKIKKQIRNLPAFAFEPKREFTDQPPLICPAHTASNIEFHEVEQSLDLISRQYDWSNKFGRLLHLPVWVFANDNSELEARPAWIAAVEGISASTDAVPKLPTHIAALADRA